MILKKWPYFFDSGTLSAISASQLLNKLGPLVANQKNKTTFLYNYICIILKKWSYFFDSSALSIISGFESLKKLGPLWANFKIPVRDPGDPSKDHLSHVW